MNNNVWIPLVMTHAYPGGDASDERIKEALPEGAYLPMQTIRQTIGGPSALNQQDWRAGQLELVRHLEKHWSTLSAGQTASLAVFALTPIPFALELGFRLHDALPFQVFQHHHHNRDWRWPGRSGAAPAIRVRGLPTETTQQDGPVVIRISASFRVHPETTQAVIPEPLAEIDLCLDPIDTITAFATQEELGAFVNRFEEVLRAIAEHLPKRTGLHLFVAGPAGMCVQLGSRINSTIYAPVFAYQYLKGEDPPYKRAFRLGRSVEELTMKLKIQFIASDPSRSLEIDREHREIKKKVLTEGKYRSRFEMETNVAMQVEALQESLDRAEPHIVHFSGHGLPGGLLWIESQREKNPHETSLDAMVDLFRILNEDGRIQLVVLNACHSLALAEALVREGVVPAAIGMIDKIKDDAAVAFSTGLYRALADGHGRRPAFDRAVNQIALTLSQTGAKIPKICFAEGADPKASLFE